MKPLALFAILVISAAGVRASTFLEISSESDIVVRGTPDAAIRFTTPTRTGGFPLASGRIRFDGAGPVRIEIPGRTAFVTVTSIAGGVDVSGIAGSVRTSAGAGKTVIDHIGGDVECRSNGGPTLLGTIAGSVQCYSGGGPIRAAVVRGAGVFETAGGDIHLGDVLGTVRAVTAAGGIHIDAAGSDVFVHTLGGPISIGKALGTVVASTAGGPIDIGGAAAVDGRSSSGAIRLSNISGPVQATTGKGSIVADISSLPPLADSYLAAADGDITVLLPSNIRATVEAERTGSGDRRSIVSSFPAIRVTRRDSAVVALGRINGGGALLRIVDGGGRIEVRRR